MIYNILCLRETWRLRTLFTAGKQMLSSTCLRTAILYNFSVYFNKWSVLPRIFVRPMGSISGVIFVASFSVAGAGTRKLRRRGSVLNLLAAFRAYTSRGAGVGAAAWERG